LHADTGNEERAADEREIRGLHQRVLDAWDAGDGEAFAAPFADDAVFEERTEVRFVAPEVAIVSAIGGTVMRGKTEPAPERDSIQTLVAVREEGRWSFTSFQNTRIRPIGAGAASALLWLVPDKLWRLLFRVSGTVPRKAT
jgi:hypothetical protein